MTVPAPHIDTFAVIFGVEVEHDSTRVDMTLATTGGWTGPRRVILRVSEETEPLNVDTYYGGIFTVTRDDEYLILGTEFAGLSFAQVCERAHAAKVVFSS